MMNNSSRDSRWTKVYRELRQEPYQAEAVRQTTIQILGIIAVANGLLIALTIPETGGSLVWFDRIWGWPFYVGMALALSGLTQLWAVIFHRPTVAAVTCYLCSIWYLLFSAGFATQYVLWAFGIEDLFHGLRPNLYPVSVYLGFSALHLAQASTIRKKDKVKNTIERLAGQHGGTLSDG